MPKPFTPESFTTFGDLLKYLRRREHLTQLELSITVGYSEAQIGRLEKNQRRPDLTALKALFIPALHLEDEPELVTRFLELAETARQEDAPAPGYAPYKGLLFFDEADADLFFGREALTIRLADRVTEITSGTSTRVLTVVGASGSGKSSLVRAGLAVTLRRADWDVRVFTPTASPLRVLETQLNSYHVKSNFEHVLLLVDQFEETFTLCHDESERIAFIKKLLSLATLTPNPFPKMGEGNAVVVIALRADFYSHCAQYPLLRQAVAAEQEYIGPMTTDELCRAIEEPARRGGWEFEPGLVDLLLNDIGAHRANAPEPGALPLVSHALLATWERRRGKTLTLEGYHASGGVRGAIAETAESVFTDQLNQQQKDIARDVFLRLTELGEGTEDTRRRAALIELERPSAEAHQLRAVLNTLAEARLITLNEDSAEVAHEALIREWQRLHQWLTEDREGLRLHRHLTESAREWELRERDTSELYRGARLSQVCEWASVNEERLNESERSFLRISIEQEQHEVLEHEAQRQRELDAAQKLAAVEHSTASRLRRRALYLAGALIMALIMTLTALFFGERARQSAASAQAESRNTVSRELAAVSINNLDVDPELCILLGLQSANVADTFEAEDALHRSIMTSRVMLTLRHNAEVWSVAFSPDGKRIATASEDKTAKIWDAYTGKELIILRGHAGSVNGVAFSPDGKYIATASDDQTVKVWDARTGENLLTLLGHTAPVLRVAFSPDGTHLVTASNDKTAKVWDISSEDASTHDLFTFIGHTGPVLDAAFSSDGTQIATSGADGAVKLWDTRSGAELLSLPVKEGAFLRGVAFSPDGRRLAVAGNFGLSVAKVWDTVTGKELFRGPSGNMNSLYDIAFSPDGRLAATGGQDRRATVWDADTGQVVFTLAGHADVINGVAFSPDGTRLATASWDGTARVWDLTPAREIMYIPASVPDEKLRLAYSPDGTGIAAGFEDDTARVWDTVSGKELLILRGHTGRVNWTVFNPDGTRIATGSADHTAKIWDARSGAELLTLDGHIGEVNGVAFSPDGTRFVTGSDDGTAIIWDVASGKTLFTLTGHIGDVIPVAFSPDGKRIVTGGEDSTAIVWDTSTGEAVLTLVDPVSTIVFAAFSPDGKSVATADSEGTAKLWDITTDKNLLTLPIQNDEALSVAFSPDGERLAVGARTGISIFTLSIDDLVALAKTRVTRSLTNAECQQYLHVDVCPSVPR